ncbi:MAG: hypothetical protein WDM80_13485 [Limisphaerales bacterium]
MSETSKVCLGKTATGDPCGAKPTSTGYCSAHDPARLARLKQLEGQKAKFREVVDSVIKTAKAKGWSAFPENEDRENWKYATVTVRRTVNVHEVTGNFDITVENGVKVHIQKTSFYGHGLDDLHGAIMTDLGHLPWLEPVDKKKAEVTVKPVTILEHLLRRFHLVARQLQHRHADRDSLIISDEYDVQDLLHALLRINFDDIRPEENTPSYAGGSSRVDFLLKKEKIIVEAKFATAKLKDKQIGEELMVDIQRYQSHPDCETLICFVYDPGGFLKNPVGLANDLSKKHDKVVVKVIVVP